MIPLEVVAQRALLSKIPLYGQLVGQTTTKRTDQSQHACEFAVHVCDVLVIRIQNTDIY